MLSSLQGRLDPVTIVGAALVTAAASGLPGLFIGRKDWGQKIAACSMIAASLAGLPAAASVILASSPPVYVIDWSLPFGPCEIGIDGLSALFLIPIFLIAACGSCYSLAYLPAAENRKTVPGLTFFWGMFAAAMAFLVMAKNGALFLMTWEVMALSGYFLLATEHEKPEVRRAGTVYLMATHAGTMALFIAFALLRKTTSSFGFPAPHSLDPLSVAAPVIFLTALVGFGAKAGVMPCHFWLPAAHANAPSHVSAMMSGVMLKMGIYGLLRVLLFFTHPPLWWGALLVFLGIASALLGILFAAAQTDIKRLLAYSSIENIGIVVSGIGAGFVGVATGDRTLTLLGMTGGLLHALNHSLFKPLLFLGSGSLIHATGTRAIDRMGGLAKRMPATAFLVLAGSVAICGLPPLNGFVGEFLLYLGFISNAMTAPVPYLSLLAPTLALTGGIAVVCFVKMYGIVFLGTPRSEEAAYGHEAARPMLAPMGLLALLCGAVALLPQFAVRLVEPAVSAVVPSPAVPGAVDALAPLQRLGAASAAIAATGVLLAFALFRHMRRSKVTAAETWGCGYQAPAPRMQYTGASFSDTVVGLFGFFVRPCRKEPATGGYAPGHSSFRYAPTEPVLDRVILPFFTVTGIAFSFLRRLQHGRIHIYMLYIFITLFLLMMWAH